MITIEISMGEAIDRLTILTLKRENFLRDVDHEKGGAQLQLKLDIVNAEFNSLMSVVADELIKKKMMLTDLEGWQELLKINNSLWKVEDRLREMDSELFLLKMELDEASEHNWGIEKPAHAYLNEHAEDTSIAVFCGLARAVYFLNDHRHKLKAQISEAWGNTVYEVKSYA